MHGTLGKANLPTAEDENEMEFGEFTGSFCLAAFCPPSKRRFTTGNLKTVGRVEGARAREGRLAGKRDLPVSQETNAAG